MDEYNAVRPRPKVYLAGPDVFLPDARAFGALKAAVCARYGLDGLFPLDNELDLDGLAPSDQARRIALANEGLMRMADGVIANLTPFRGTSMDAGTAFEVGFMRALDRPIFAYTTAAGDYAARVRAVRALVAAVGDFDRADVEIEDFGLAENLMIAIAATESGGSLVAVAEEGDGVRWGLSAFEGAVKAAARHFGTFEAPATEAS
jgi:nucleoside 2-deoxyribosyltransferase